MRSLIRTTLGFGRDLLMNACASVVVGRKLATVDQGSYWRTRALGWRREVASVVDDPYYAGLDRCLLETLAGLPGARRFLEVGCFFGYRLAKVQAALSEARVVGLDVVFDALKAARESGDGLAIHRLVNGDATCLPFRSGAMDCVYTVTCLTHIPESLVGKALDEIVRVTRRYLVLIEVYDRLMRLPQRIRVRAWTAGYCHPYKDLLARRGLVPVRVEGLQDSTGHPRYTLFVCAKETC